MCGLPMLNIRLSNDQMRRNLQNTATLELAKATTAMRQITPMPEA